MALCDLDVVPFGKVRFSHCHSALSGGATTTPPNNIESCGDNIQGSGF